MVFKKLLRWLAAAVGGLVILCTGIWGTLAIWFHSPPIPASRELLPGVFLLLAVLAAVCLVLRRWRVVAVYAACFMIVLGSWASLKPSNNREWSGDVARLATGTVDGDSLVVQNVRNLHWTSDADFDSRWETRTYDLNRLTGVDLFMSYWNGEEIAHTIVSFGFSDGQHLAFSIETRKEKGESYSALAGFFRAYELAYVAADERDVLGVRTNWRDEDVRIYRLRMVPATARGLLLEYVAELNDLAREPKFYNSLTTNCSTQVFRMVRTLRPDVPLDYRIVLNGHMPDFVYELGALDTSMPFATLRDKSHIKGKANSDDPDFSAKIRVGVPSPR